jgi:hypothetical protein
MAYDRQEEERGQAGYFRILRQLGDVYTLFHSVWADPNLGEE